jgi:hypothetical protein
MKKLDGPGRSWPTPYTTPFFLPPEDPYPVLLRPNSIPEHSAEMLPAGVGSGVSESRVSDPVP